MSLAVRSVDDVIGLEVESLESMAEKVVEGGATPTAVDNDKALAELQAMMKGVDG